MPTLWCATCDAAVNSVTHAQKCAGADMKEKDVQEALDAGDLPGTPSEVRALRSAYEAGRRAARMECALLILNTPMEPGFVLQLCREWMGAEEDA